MDTWIKGVKIINLTTKIIRMVSIPFTEIFEPSEIRNFGIEEDVDRDCFIEIIPNVFVPIKIKKKVPIENMPEPKINTMYIVSKKVAKLFPEREDLIYVDKTSAIKDEVGNVYYTRFNSFNIK